MSADPETQEALQKIIHQELQSAIQQQDNTSWPARNMPWLLTVGTLALGGFFWVLNLKGKVDMIQSNMEHHVTAPYHDGMRTTEVVLARIEAEIRNLREAMASLQKKIDGM